MFKKGDSDPTVLPHNACCLCSCFCQLFLVCCSHLYPFSSWLVQPPTLFCSHITQQPQPQGQLIVDRAQGKGVPASGVLGGRGLTSDGVWDSLMRWPSNRKRTDCRATPCRWQNAFINFDNGVPKSELIIRNGYLNISVLSSYLNS